VTKPNVFFIGAMKSGTTYLSDLLGAHPSVFVSDPREPCHFVDERVLRKVWSYAWHLRYWQSEERYLSLFAAAGAARIVVDASTFYSQTPLFRGVPARIHAFNPEARFIYLLRDPIERTISHYWHCVRHWGEERPMYAAIRKDPRYIDASHYARQLRAYFEHFGQERFYVLTLESLVRNLTAQLGALYAWLGVDASLCPSANVSGPVNTRPALIRMGRGFGLLRRLKESSLYGRIKPLVPAMVRHWASSLSVREVMPEEIETAQVESFLRPILLRHTEELSRLTGRTYPEWTTLHSVTSAAGQRTSQGSYGAQSKLRSTETS
jgi:hypothetical protein